MKIDENRGCVHLKFWAVNGIFYCPERFLPGSSLFLPTGDVVSEIKKRNINSSVVLDLHLPLC